MSARREPLPGPGSSRAEERERMVADQIVARGIEDPRVLEAMRKIPRHRFVPPRLQRSAYEDGPLSIGDGQTISQPYIVAFMTEALRLAPHDRVLEIGAGSGYQTAILAELVAAVYAIEIIPALAQAATRAMQALGHDHVHLRTGDGYRGWPEAAPFDAILVAAAPDHVPEPLVDQLAMGGRMVLPVGDGFQELLFLERTPAGVTRRKLLSVRFVPMTGEARK